MANSHNAIKESRARKEKYKELLDMGAAVVEQSANVTDSLHKVTIIMEHSTDIGAEVSERERVNTTSEAVLDAQVLKMGFELMGNALSNAADATFNDDTYFNAIMNVIGNDQDWEKLMLPFLKGSRMYRGTQSMFGTLQLDAPATVTVQKQRRERARTQATQQVKPNSGNPQATEKRAQFLNVILQYLRTLFQENNNQPIPYYKLVCDPNSFEASIENLFQLSFIFRDGLVYFSAGDDGFPMVSLVTDTQIQSGTFIDHQQFVSSMSPSLWQEMIERYGIVEPLLNINREEFFDQTQTDVSVGNI